MVVVEFLKKYKHTEARTWEKGERPTLAKSLAFRLTYEGYTKMLGWGCGCPGQANQF